MSSQEGIGNMSNQITRDKEERLRLLKEKQNEERLRKLEELKQQAIIAQKFREEKEEERRRRIEELRLRDLDKRQQVEERKRQIWETERDRREAILRKNQDREARIEAKKRHDRSSIMFAFGSSTPRMLEPADTGGSYWASRRATSTTNVMSMSMSMATPPPPGPLTRRSSERELNDGNKKRATSAGQMLDGDDLMSGTVQPFRTAYRRKTDLMPTIPLSSRTPGSKSGDTTPSRLSSCSTRPQAMPRRPRPASIAITGVSSSPSDFGGSRTSLSSDGRNSKPIVKPPLPKVHVTKKPMQPKKSLDVTTKKSSAKSSKQSSVCSTPGLQSPISDISTVHYEFNESVTTSEDLNKENLKMEDTVLSPSPQPDEKVEEIVKVVETVKDEEKKEDKIIEETISLLKETSLEPSKRPASPVSENDEVLDMNSSMTAKTIIATEEEAKAILAERRRLARKQAEREAEMERQAQEAARQAELDAQRKLEEESLRLIEEAKRVEEQRLLQAIEETRQREEEERKRRDEELRQKLEKEELERKAKEEAEKQRIELEIRLKKEEEDRQIRRKRVEDIMLRTRGKGSTPTNSNKDDSDMNNMTEDNDSSINNSSNDISKENESNGFNHTNGHHNGFSDKINEQNVVSNTIMDLNSSHADKTGVDFLNLDIPTIIPTESSVNNVNNFNNSQSTGNIVAPKTQLYDTQDH